MWSLGRQRTRLKYLLSRPIADQWLVAQTAVLLGATRAFIVLLPFERLERLLGDRLTESDQTIPPANMTIARKVGWAVRIVSPNTPWTSNCFPQALTAKLLLRRRGIESTLYVGAAFTDDKSALKAHAWLRCGQFYITGGDGGDEFGAIISYV